MANEGGSQINWYTEMEGGSRITWSVIGMKKEDVDDPEKADYSDWLEAELASMLENSLTDQLREEISNSSRDYELLMTKYNSEKLGALELQDDIDNWKKREEAWNKQKASLLHDMEEMSAEHEDLISQLNAASSSAEAEKQIASLTRKNKKLEKDHEAEMEQVEHLEEELAELQQRYDALEAQEKNDAEEASHATLLLQQKETMSSRIKDLETEIEQMKRNFMSATKAKEEALAAKRASEEQFQKMQTEVNNSVNARMAARTQITQLKEENDKLKEELEDVRINGAKSARGNARGNIGLGEKDKQISLLEHELEEQKAEYEEVIDRKDRMLGEVKDALKSLGLKLGNLDSRMAIPKLKALLSILTKQVAEYKGRQRELEHLVKSRTNELAYYKEHFGDRNKHRGSIASGLAE